MKRDDLHKDADNALKATVDWSNVKLKTNLKKVEKEAPGAVGVVEETFKPTEISNVLMQIKGQFISSIVSSPKPFQHKIANIRTNTQLF